MQPMQIGKCMKNWKSLFESYFDILKFVRDYCEIHFFFLANLDMKSENKWYFSIKFQ